MSSVRMLGFIVECCTIFIAFSRFFFFLLFASVFCGSLLKGVTAAEMRRAVSDGGVFNPGVKVEAWSERRYNNFDPYTSSLQHFHLHDALEVSIHY